MSIIFNTQRDTAEIFFAVWCIEADNQSFGQLNSSKAALFASAAVFVA